MTLQPFGKLNLLNVIDSSDRSRDHISIKQCSNRHVDQQSLTTKRVAFSTDQLNN